MLTIDRVSQENKHGSNWQFQRIGIDNCKCQLFTLYFKSKEGFLCAYGYNPKTGVFFLSAN